MNGFLVLVRCGADDIPVRLCETKEHAVAVAKELTLSVVENVLRLIGLDVSIYCNVSVCTFEDGSLVGVDVVRDFDDEEDCEFPS